LSDHSTIVEDKVVRRVEIFDLVRDQGHGGIEHCVHSCLLKVLKDQVPQLLPMHMERFLEFLIKAGLLHVFSDVEEVFFHIRRTDLLHNFIIT